MLNITEKIINSALKNRAFTSEDFASHFACSSASRYGLINNALKKGEIIKLRRGLYILNSKYLSHPASKYYLASRILDHSYISFGSALSFHRWIPERVTAIMSATAQTRKKSFANEYGRFYYFPIPINCYEYFTGVERFEDQHQPFFMASPLRAICDLIYSQKINNANTEYLIHSLRVEMDDVLSITHDEITALHQAYRSKRVLDFLTIMQKEISIHEK